MVDVAALAPDPDGPLLARLRQGDERAFATLVDRYATSMLRVALLYVPSRAVAEEKITAASSAENNADRVREKECTWFMGRVGIG